MKPLVYLAGPIAGCTGFEAIDWREYAVAELGYRDIEALSPMRLKHFDDDERIGSDFHVYQERSAFHTSKGIMLRDRNDVLRCDALLVNFLNARQVSAGTAMELAWADLLRTPVVVAIEEQGNPHDDHPMIHEAMSFRVTSLDQAIDAVAVILGR